MSLGISEYIDYLITSEETGADKPDEKILDVTLEKIKINKEKLILIGNNPEKDIPIAVNNGIDAILVDTYGVHNDQKEESTYYVMDFNEINEILNFYPEEFTQDKLIILDLIGTLTKHNHLRSEVLTKEFELSLNHVTEPYEQYKVNEIPKKEFWKKLGIENYKEAEERLLSYMELKPEAIKLIKKLQGKAKLAILSNIPKDWGEAIIKNNNLTKYFDKIILSGEVEMLKSKPEMYKLLTEEFPKILPENMYFVDNELEDLLSGKDFLLNTIWFSQEKPDAKFIPDFIVKTFDELDELLFNLIRS
jgi:FMN phosphatase YigB (HAD superfamily)